jgi:hypothetical protein
MTYSGDSEGEVDAVRKRTSSVFIPALLIALAVVGWLAFQTV